MSVRFMSSEINATSAELFFLLPPTLRESAIVSQFPVMMCINLKKIRETVHCPGQASVHEGRNELIISDIVTKPPDCFIEESKTHTPSSCLGKKKGSFTLSTGGISQDGQEENLVMDHGKGQ